MIEATRMLPIWTTKSRRISFAHFLCTSKFSTFVEFYISLVVVFIFSWVVVTTYSDYKCFDCCKSHYIAASICTTSVIIWWEWWRWLCVCAALHNAKFQFFVSLHRLRRQQLALNIVIMEQNKKKRSPSSFEIQCKKNSSNFEKSSD